jgi:hypothetical protein
MLSGASAALLVGAAAQAATVTSATSGDWDQGGTWVGGNVPAAGDDVVIAAGHVVTLDDARTCQTLVIQTGAGGNGQLRIDGSSSVWGELTFNAAGSPSLSIAPANGVVLVEFARIIVPKTMSFSSSSGVGSLQGLDNAVEIAIDTDNSTPVTLTVSVLAHGKMTFKKHDAGTAAANLINDFKFLADASGNFTLASTLNSVDDTPSSDGCSSPRWVVDTAGANLIFNVEATGLSAGFLVDNGTLVCNANVTTAAVGGAPNSGKFKFMGGGAVDVDAGNGIQFAFAGICPGSTCSPSSPISADTNCH